MVLLISSHLHWKSVIWQKLHHSNVSKCDFAYLFYHFQTNYSWKALTAFYNAVHYALLISLTLVEVFKKWWLATIMVLAHFWVSGIDKWCWRCKRVLHFSVQCLKLQVFEYLERQVFWKDVHLFIYFPTALLVLMVEIIVLTVHKKLSEASGVTTDI